jgi:LPS-assembly protein
MPTPSPAFCCAIVLVAATASLQGQQPIPGVDNASAGRQERLGENHIRLVDTVELRMGDTEFYADHIEFFIEESRAVATGNVLLAQGDARIAAERADFNTRTKLGTFYDAAGFATVKPQQARPGAVAVPPVSQQDTDVYFYGDTVEKVGPRKYRITKGGFTTCVQPTPRWMLTSKTVVLHLDHYTLLRDTVFSVKGVPLLYTPILYYPTKEEDRATGLLIPTYGASSLRGHSFYNAFFWAINRSHDATFLYDWFSKTGYGTGSEYRYNLGGGSDGNVRVYVLDEDETTYTQDNGTVTTQPAMRSFEVRGGANQFLKGGLRARANVNYFSSVTTMQTYNTNIYDASRNTRSYGGNISGSWGPYSLNVTLNRNEYFYNTTNSGLTGNFPRVTVTRTELPLGRTPLYFSVMGEYAGLLRQTHDTANPAAESNLDVTRLDFLPQVRFPFKKWQWFSVNSSLSWRDTFYTRSVASQQSLVAVDEPVNRRFFTAQAQMVGPVFNRVWDTPTNGYAEKFKHSIEPFFNIQRTSSIDDFDHIIRIDGTDAIVGGTTQLTYGVANRIYAKRRVGQTSHAREIVTVQFLQTYYTDQRAAQFDPRYSTSFSGTPPSNFSPVALIVRAFPADNLTATFNADYDTHYGEVRTISANGTYSWAGRLQTTVGWSKKNFIAELPGFNDPARLDQFINATTNVQTPDNRVGGIYAFSYDVLNARLLQQRISAFYNAQCCGVAFEYQIFKFGGVGGAPVPSDRRFFLSFTLAGLGNFSPFNGAMSGVPR